MNLAKHSFPKQRLRNTLQTLFWGWVLIRRCVRLAIMGLNNTVLQVVMQGPTWGTGMDTHQFPIGLYVLVCV